MLVEAQTPLHRLLKKPASGVAPITFITSSPSSSPRNNFDGGVGFGFTVGASNITVTELGRWVISGNSGSHLIKIVDAAGAIVGTGSATLNTSGLSVGYNYVSITPLVLTAGNTYYLVSDEANGGDQWNDEQPVTSTADATVIGSYYIIGTGGFNPPQLAASGVRAYVPVNFKYHL